MIQLQDRTIIEVSGDERKKFLQGLITNDINKVSAENLLYACMLNAAGRFLYDFFIFEQNEKIFLDCYAPRCAEIITKLNFYKLRSQVEIKKNEELKILWNQTHQGFPDPRNQNLGHRLYTTNYPLPTTPHRLNYDLLRISLKTPESELDLSYEKSFILEFGFDALNAVDYNKGCYVGQEPTARTHHLGEIRKKIFHVKISGKNEVEKNSKLTCEGKDVGQILSSVFFENELHALALIKPSEVSDFSSIFFENHKIFIVD